MEAKSVNDVEGKETKETKEMKAERCMGGVKPRSKPYGDPYKATDICSSPPTLPGYLHRIPIYHLRTTTV